jgi:hypothetical protein
MCQHFLIQAGPQVAAHPAVSAIAVSGFGFARGIDSADDVGHVDFFSTASQGITAPRSACAFNQTLLAQFAEQLFQVGQRNVVAFADGGQGHGASVFTQGDIDHGRHGKSAFGAQTHVLFLSAQLAQTLFSQTSSGKLGWPYVNQG